MSKNKCCCDNQNDQYLSVPYFYCICGGMKHDYMINESIESLLLDNDSQHVSIFFDNRSMSVDHLPDKKQSIDSISNVDNIIMNAMPQEAKARSQTSLLTTMSSIPTDSNPTSPIFDNQHHEVMKQTVLQHVSNSKSVTNHSRSAKSSSTSANMSVTGQSTDKDKKTESVSIATNVAHYHPPLVKSASSSGLVQCQTLEDHSSVCHNHENTHTDNVDGASCNVVISSGDGNTTTVKWNATLVDIEMTEIMLQSLGEHIKDKRDKISKDISQKEEMVDKLISNFTLNSDSKSSKKIRREFESMNKSSEKSLEKTKMELEQLEYKRLIVGQEGIPWGVKPSDYVKSISKKDRNKRSVDPPLKEGPGSVARLLKGYVQKSASAENVSQLANAKSHEPSTSNRPWALASETIQKGKDMTIDESPKLPIVSSDYLSKTINQKPNSVGNSSAISGDLHAADRGLQMRKSKSNSVSSGTGRDHLHEAVENHESPRNQSFSVASADETPRSEDVSMFRLQLLQDEMALMRKEIHEVRSECHRFQCETDNLRLDMNTHSEINSQKMQNAIERVDRLERILDLLRQQCQIEFCTWKDEFHSLEEKLDYRLTTTRRDLQDNIDACNNSISLVEKRTEQMPFMSNRGGKSDVKIITDHLCNLIVSLIAFIMLLISSGFHLLIRFLNIGATISQNRNTVLIPLIALVVLVTVTIKWSLIGHLQDWLSDSEFTPL